MESSVLELEVKFVETDPNKGVTIGLGPHSKEATNLVFQWHLFLFAFASRACFCNFPTHGAGSVPWKDFFGALRSSGYTGPVTFESFSNKVVAPFCVPAQALQWLRRPQSDGIERIALHISMLHGAHLRWTPCACGVTCGKTPMIWLPLANFSLRKLNGQACVAFLPSNKCKEVFITHIWSRRKKPEISWMTSGLKLHRCV